MKGQNDDTGSGSDWDSMTEMDPAPTKVQKTISGPSTATKQNTSVSRQMPKGRSSRHQEIDRGQDDAEPPPFDFKNEAGNAPRSEMNLLKPGKERKGTVYDPQSPRSKKQVSFNQQSPRNVSNNDNESDEDPLYSTVKPKHVRQKENHIENLDTNFEDTGEGFKVKKLLPKLKIKSSSKMPLVGMDNKGYIEDENNQTLENNTALDPTMENFNTSPEMLEPISAPDPLFVDSGLSQNHLCIQKSNKTLEPKSAALQDWSPPLVLTSIDSHFQSGDFVLSVNQAVGQAFTLVSVPFLCAAIFLHHLLRFLLLGLIKPFVVDSLTLVVELLLRPLTLGVVRPLLLLMHTLSLTVSDTCLVLLRPIVQVLKAFRLVEVNHTRRYSLEDV